MKRKTNLDKCRDIQSECTRLVSEYLGLYPPLPNPYYYVEYGEVKTPEVSLTITPKRLTFLPNLDKYKRATKEDVQKHIDYLENIKNSLDISCVYVHFNLNGRTWNSRYERVVASIFHSLEDANKLAEEQCKKYEDIHTPKDGQFVCDYCGSVADNVNKRRRCVTVRTGGYVRDEDRVYCSGQCATYDTF